MAPNGSKEKLGGGNSNIFYFHPNLGWFNHQPEKHGMQVDAVQNIFWTTGANGANADVLKTIVFDSLLNIPI